MIRGLAMVRRDWVILAASERKVAGGTGQNILWEWAVDIGFGALEPGAAGLILGM
jgi:hypothetical protein